jgi:hypothetical protein
MRSRSGLVNLNFDNIYSRFLYEINYNVIHVMLKIAKIYTRGKKIHRKYTVELLIFMESYFLGLQNVAL